MSIPHISVIMGVYNGAEYLKDSVDSILNQSYTDFEYIIINDGSTDNTSDILKDYTDQRLKIIDQEHLGLTKSLNNAIQLSKGEYIARQDADDLSMQDRFIQQINYLNSNIDISIVGTWHDTIDIYGDLFKTVGVNNNIDQIKNVLMNRLTPFAHGSTMMRKNDIIEIGLYDERFTFSQDYNLWLRLLKENLRIAIIEKSLYKLRYCPDTNMVKNLCQKEYTDLSLKYYLQGGYGNNPGRIEKDIKNKICSQLKQKLWSLRNRDEYYYRVGIQALKMKYRIKAVNCLIKSMKSKKNMIIIKSSIALFLVILPNKLVRILLILPLLHISNRKTNVINHLSNLIKNIINEIKIEESSKIYIYGNNCITK